MATARKMIAVLALLLGVALMSASPAQADAAKKEGGEKEPELVERAMGLAGWRTHWDAAVSWAKLKAMELRQRPAVESGPDGSPSIKEAVSKSVDSSREAAETAARTAAEAVDRTVHKAKETVDEVTKKTHGEL